MSIITININNKLFPIACEDGQEELVNKATQAIIKKIEQLKLLSPTATTEYLFLLCAISLQNELLNNQNSENQQEDHDKLEQTLEEILAILEKLKK